MRRRISIRGCVRPSVRPSVGPSVRRSVGPSGRRSVTPSLRRLLGASYAEYSALFVFQGQQRHLTWKYEPSFEIKKNAENVNRHVANISQIDRIWKSKKDCEQLKTITKWNWTLHRFLKIEASKHSFNKNNNNNNDYNENNNINNINENNDSNSNGRMGGGLSKNSPSSPAGTVVLWYSNCYLN